MLETVKNVVSDFVDVARVAKVVSAAVVSFLVTQVGLDASVAESIGAVILTAAAVYLPANKPAPEEPV
jgi:hypothetical protein